MRSFSRRGILTGLGGVAASTGLPFAGTANAYAGDRIDIDAGHEEFLGRGFLENIAQLIPDVRFVYIDKKIFSPTLRYLSNVANPLLSLTATDENKQTFARDTITRFFAETEDRPVLREYLQNQMLGGEAELVRNANRLVQLCGNMHAMATANFHAHRRDARSNISIIIAPTDDFFPDDLISDIAGIAKSNVGDISGTQVDWARLVVLHECGHGDFEDVPRADFSGVRDVCHNAFHGVNHERYGDRFMQQHFVAENPVDSEAIQRKWLYTRALSLFDEATYQNLVNGDEAKFVWHSTALAIDPERASTAVSSQEHVIANIIASDFIREVAFALPVARMIEDLAPEGVDPKLGITRMPNANNRGLDKATFAAIAQGIIERDGFENMPLAGDAARLYVDAVNISFPALKDDMLVPYERMMKYVRDLPAPAFATIKSIFEHRINTNRICLEPAPEVSVPK
ncbi:MAG: hypothetical protein GC136_09615 [Alphaproteobacteria bacterium]|nr:hypothetical protein [Alphaproteobacteria bacterium]